MIFLFGKYRRCFLIFHVERSWKFSALFTKQGCTITESARLRRVERTFESATARRWRRSSLHLLDRQSSLGVTSCFGLAWAEPLKDETVELCKRGFTSLTDVLFFRGFGARVSARGREIELFYYRSVCSDCSLGDSLSLSLSGADIWNFCLYFNGRRVSMTRASSFQCEFWFIRLYDRIIVQSSANTWLEVRILRLRK